MNIEPIGYFSCRESSKSEVPRQPHLSTSQGQIVLNSGHDFEQALRGLEGFKKIWVLFAFHENSKWKPMVRPQNQSQKVGVFATRAPYRPNFIGMSCLDLLKIDGLNLTVRGHDLLDQSPIFDIKPYHPDADSFSQSEALAESCWLKSPDQFSVEWNLNSKIKSDWLENTGVENIKTFVQTQLSTQPVDQSRKRISEISQDEFELSYKTWRIRYRINLQANKIVVEDVYSGYSPSELFSDCDRYGDFEVHKKFIDQFINHFGVRA